MRSARHQVELRRLGNQLPVLGNANSLWIIVKIGVFCLFVTLRLTRPGHTRCHRSSGKIREASRRCTAAPVAPPGGDFCLLTTPLFTLFRPLCPAFSFADVDTYAVVTAYNWPCPMQFLPNSVHFHLVKNNRIITNNQVLICVNCKTASFGLWPTLSRKVAKS